MTIGKFKYNLWFACAVIAITSYVSPASAGHLAGGASPDISIIRVIAALLVSLAVGLGLVFLQRKFPGRTKAGQVLANLAGELARSRRIDVVEARRISVHADVCLVRCDADEYLIVCGPAGSTVLRAGLVTQPVPVHVGSEDLPG